MAMDESELLSVLQTREDAAKAYIHGQLGEERELALREYYRMPYGNEEDGWSQIVTSDVQDSVEWVLASLMKTFSSTDKAVSFEPSKQEDVQGAEQATDACNYVFYKQNNGFLVLYTALKDMLTIRNCAVMWRKETKQTVSSLPFKNASTEMLAMLLQEHNGEIESSNEAPAVDELGQPVFDDLGQQVMMYSGRIKKTEDRVICKVEAFSPEDLLIERDWTSPLLEDCPYVCRLMHVTLSDLKIMGYKDVSPEDLRGSNSDSYTNGGRLANITQSEKHDLSIEQDHGDDDSMAEGWLRIEYVLADADGDGIAERLCVYRLENKILKQEVISHVPIATASPVLNPHRWDGMSFHDIVGDLQKQHTELLRQMFNNLYLTNNPQRKVLTDGNWTPLANIDDLLDNRAGGILRQRQTDAIQEHVTPFAAGASMPMLEYLQNMRENRTGVSRTSMGLNPDSLNNTATGRAMDMTAAQQRIELIARIIAETLVKPIFQGILKVLTDGEMERLSFRLRDQFVEYDPNEWRDQYDMTVNVGLGTGDVQQKAQQLMMIAQLQKEGLAINLATPKHIYHTGAKIIENAGFKDVEKFIQDPSASKPMPPPLNPVIEAEKLKQHGAERIEQIRVTADIQKHQAISIQNAENERLKHEAKLAEIQGNLELQAANDARDSQRAAEKAQADAIAQAQQLEFDKWKANLDAQTKIYIEEMKIRGVVPEDAEQEQLAMRQVMEGLQAVMDRMSAPKIIVRDETGRAVGVTQG